MRRCHPDAQARCPLREYCEPDAEFTDDCECAKFNDKILDEIWRQQYDQKEIY